MPSTWPVILVLVSSHIYLAMAARFSLLADTTSGYVCDSRSCFGKVNEREIVPNRLTMFVMIDPHRRPILRLCGRWWPLRSLHLYGRITHQLALPWRQPPAQAPPQGVARIQSIDGPRSSEAQRAVSNVTHVNTIDHVFQQEKKKKDVNTFLLGEQKYIWGKIELRCKQLKRNETSNRWAG